MPNTLFTNDNLFILTGLNSEIADLIYLDPPFNSKRTYAAPIGSKSAGASFKDMWTWKDVNEAYLDKLIENYPSLVDFINSIEASHSKAMKAYITYMAQRMIELYRILKMTGSIYLHCDPTASHYLKQMMDAIFGKDNFRNEIVWSYKRWTATSRDFQRLHDVIYRYSKTTNFYFENQYDLSSNEKKGVHESWILDNETQKYFRWQSLKGERYKIWKNEKGVKMGDVWDIPFLHPSSKERTGYPTQKPLALLQRIITASSKEGDLVLDPFCGCATTCVAAQRLKREWIGIDIEEKAIEILVERLEKDGYLADDLKFKSKGDDFIHRKDVPQRTDVAIISPADKPVKERLFQEQKGRCKACDVDMRIVDFEVDHIIPKSKGGGDYYDNYQLLCASCNRIKGDRPMEYLRSKIKTREKYIKKIQFGE